MSRRRPPLPDPSAGRRTLSRCASDHEGGHARRGRGAVNVPQACAACSALRPRRPSDQRWAYSPSSLTCGPSLDRQSTAVLGLSTEGKAGAPPIDPGGSDTIADTGVRSHHAFWGVCRYRRLTLSSGSVQDSGVPVQLACPAYRNPCSGPGAAFSQTASGQCLATHRLSGPTVTLEPSTFRLRVGPKPSNWTHPEPSWLLRYGTDFIQCRPVGPGSSVWVASEVATTLRWQRCACRFDASTIRSQSDAHGSASINAQGPPGPDPMVVTTSGR
jgi:hypothetical protein